MVALSRALQGNTVVATQSGVQLLLPLCDHAFFVCFFSTRNLPGRNALRRPPSQEGCVIQERGDLVLDAPAAKA